MAKDESIDPRFLTVISLAKLTSGLSLAQGLQTIEKRESSDLILYSFM